jgi:cellulose biosynthesis protein BcsQ
VDSFETEVARADALEKAFSACDKPFDILVVDTPSGLGRVTTAALACADFALLAFQTESLSLRSVGQALKVVEHVQATRNPRLRLVGILPTLVERERHGSQTVLARSGTAFRTLSRPSCREPGVRPREHAGPVGFLGSRPERRRQALTCWPTRSVA